MRVGKHFRGITLSREEKILLDTIVSVVGSGKSRSINLSDNFFEIGGNSLNAVTVVVRLRDQGFKLGKLIYEKVHDNITM